MKKLTRYLGDNELKAKEQYEKNKEYCDSVILREKLYKAVINDCKKGTVEPKNKKPANKKEEKK